MQYLSMRETKAFFRKVESPRDKALFLLAYHHGLRVSEVCGMKLSDFDFEKSRVLCRRQKGSISGFQVIAQGEASALVEWLEVRQAQYTGIAFLFPGRSGALSRKACDKLMKKYGELAKLPKSKRHMHIWKHTIAVHLLSGGADVKLVQELLGHRNINNTLVYAQLVNAYRDERQRELFSSEHIFDTTPASVVKRQGVKGGDKNG